MQRKRIGMTLLELLVIIGIIGALVALILPATRSGIPAARRTLCRNNLKQISLALHRYHDKYQTFPPAFTVDAQGKRLHSWRTLILPYLDQETLYEKIDLSKPWDDPVNSEAAKTRVHYYACATLDKPEQKTTYLGVVGPECAFLPGQSRRLSDFHDGLSDTLMIVEANEAQGVHWMSPQDADENMVLSLVRNDPEAKFPHEGQRTIAFADGHCGSISAEVTPETLHALITIAGKDTPGEW